MNGPRMELRARDRSRDKKLTPEEWGVLESW